MNKSRYYVFIYFAHTELTIQNYPLTHTQFPPRVWIYPVSRFGELLPDILPPRVDDLKRLISYVSNVKDALEAQAPGSFSPTINSLNSLVMSITVLQ